MRLMTSLPLEAPGETSGPPQEMLVGLPRAAGAVAASFGADRDPGGRDLRADADQFIRIES